MFASLCHPLEVTPVYHLSIRLSFSCRIYWWSSRLLSHTIQSIGLLATMITELEENPIPVKLTRGLGCQFVYPPLC